MSLPHLPSPVEHRALMGCEAASASEARHALGQVLALREVARSSVADATHVLYELVMNSVEHGCADGDGKIEVAWTIHGTRLAITVRDSGTPADGQSVVCLEPTPGLPGGRGLAMVEAFSDDWTSERGDAGTSVTARLTLG